MTRAAWSFIAGSSAAFASVDIGRHDALWTALDLIGCACGLWLAHEAKS